MSISGCCFLREGQGWGKVACVSPWTELLNYTFYGWQSRWIHYAQPMVWCVKCIPLFNAVRDHASLNRFAWECLCSSLCRFNRLVSERTNGKMKSAMLIKIIYQKVYSTITNHLECNKGEYNKHTHLYL